MSHLVTPEHPFELRSHFKAPGSPQAEAKVFIAHLPEEIGPSDWLAIFLDSQKEQTLHQRLTPHEGGAVPDVLTLGGAPGEERISRWIVLKDHAVIGGAHFFVLQASTAAQDYTAALADVLLLAVSNFNLLHSSGWAYAEQLQTLVWVMPAVLRMTFPFSWKQQENPASNEHFYQIKLLKSRNDRPVGRLSLAMVAGQTEATMRRLEQEDRRALAAAGVVFEPAELGVGPPVGPLGQILTATMRQTNAAPNEPAQERLVVIGQVSDSIWIYADRVSFMRDSEPESWAVSKRAFEMLLERLEIY